MGKYDAAYGADALSSAVQTGGAGGAGLNGADGGAGADGSADNAVLTVASGQLTEVQTVTGGAGGYSSAATPGTGA